jgi:uncharacterized protein (TIGR00730 family)
MIDKRKPYTLEEIKNSCKMIVGDDGKLLEVCRVTEELTQGLEMLSKYKKLVTIYGSAQFSHGHPMVARAEEVAKRLVKEANVGIITGGGPGIMSAANKGAFEAGGVSLGASIVIPTEQTTNPYVTEEIPFQYFFTRKTALRFGTEMAICFPGGYGTLDETFEILNLIKTGKISQFPIVLYGSNFWKPLDAYFESVLNNEYGTIAPEDRNIYVVTDDIDEIVELAKLATSKEQSIERY